MYARRFIQMTCILIAICGSSGCSKETGKATTSPPPTQDMHTPGAVQPVKAPAAPAGAIATGSGFHVTIDDFERSLERGILTAPDAILAKGVKAVPRDRFHVPFVQNTTTRALVMKQLSQLEAEKRGISISLTELEDFARQDPMLSRFIGDVIVLGDGTRLDYGLSELGMTIADVHELARERLLKQRLEDKLIEEVTDEQIWRAWSHAHDRLRAVIVRVSNTPTSAEIDDFITSDKAAKTSEIKNYFDANARRYRRPRMVEVTILRAKKEGQRDLLEEAASLLEAGQTAANVASQLDLELATKQHLVRQEDPSAFRAKLGERGVSMRAPRGDYMWEVTGVLESEPAKLERSLEREIASTLLQQSNQVHSAKGRAAKVVAKLRDLPASPTKEQLVPLTALDRPGSIKAWTSDWLVREDNGFVTGVGANQTFQDRLFELTEEKSLLATPIVGDQYLWVARLIEREHPDRAVFDAQKEQNRARFLEAVRPRIFDINFRTWSEDYNVKLDLSALREKYGKPEKPR